MSKALDQLKKIVTRKMGERNAEVVESFGILLVHHKKSRQFKWFDTWEDVAKYYNIAR